jgi:Holliday junction resolvase-like predicted endonuclease
LSLAKAWICFRGAELCAARREGEIDLIGYDGGNADVCRGADADGARGSEVSAAAEKQHLVGRTARRFLMERHVKECPVRFDVLAIEEFSGQAQWYACTRMLLTRGGKKAHWKIRRNHRNAVI